MNRKQLAQQFFDNLMDSPSDSIIKSISVEVYPAYRVFRVDGRLPGRPSDYEIALVNIHTREIAYYLDVALLESDLGAKTAIHALPYRSTNAGHRVALEGFASSVLFDYLVPSHTIILADGNQWAGGPFVWHSKVSQAIYYGRNTYFLQPDGALRRLASNEDHQRLTDELWSQDMCRQINLVAISRTELGERTDVGLLQRQIERRMHLNPEHLILGHHSQPSAADSSGATS